MSEKVIKYKDSYLTIKNYKEPLKEIPKGEGFGYYGCFLVTTDGKFGQCHICGELFSSVSLHVLNKHKVGVKEYRKRFELSPSTALISEEFRAQVKQRTIDWLKGMSKEDKQAFIKRRSERWKIFIKRKINKVQPKITLETKNKRGTCPDQLISKIHEVAKKLGHTPTLSEFIDATDGQRFKHLIFATFGSWLNALKIANLDPHTKRENGGNKKSSRKPDYVLLESLALFSQENNKIPTATDCKRGFLPDYAIYRRRFGTFENARKLAKVYDFIR